MQAALEKAVDTFGRLDVALSKRATLGGGERTNRNQEPVGRRHDVQWLPELFRRIVRLLSRLTGPGSTSFRECRETIRDLRSRVGQSLGQSAPSPRGWNRSSATDALGLLGRPVQRSAWSSGHAS